MAYTLMVDHTLRFSVNQADLSNDDSGISVVFATYRVESPSTGMFIQQVLEQTPQQKLGAGLLLLMALGGRRLHATRRGEA